MKKKQTIKKNFTGGVNRKQVSSNPAPRTKKEIDKVYKNAKPGNAFYQGKK